MISYNIPITIDSEINELEKVIYDFKNNKISSKEFRSYRVPFGVYEQRKDNTYMIRIRCSCGIITPKQLTKVAELSKKYGNGSIHITTRQELQIHYVELDNILPLIKDLKEINLITRGGGGNTIRNIVAQSDTGIRKDDVFDVTHYAISLTNYLITENDSWNLPRKFKIAFSSNSNDEGYATVSDLGFIAKIKDGKKGFKVYVAGGMGAKSEVAKVLFDFIEDNEILNITKAIKNIFNKYGNRKNKHANRLRFLYSNLGKEEFNKIFFEEFEKIKNEKFDFNLINEIENKDQSSNIIKEEPIDLMDFNLWKKRFVIEQKQTRLYSILIPIELGLINETEAKKFGNFLINYGDNTIRFTKEQNILLRNISEQYLGNLYNFLKNNFKNFNTPKLINTIISCTGADTCKLGICYSQRNLEYAIIPKLLKSNLELDLIDNLKININGCPNSCGQHPVADIGFSGKASRKMDYLYPSYNVYIGAKIGEDKTKFNHLIGEIPAYKLSDFLIEVIDKYIKFTKNNNQDFIKYLNNRGEEEIKSILNKYKEIPDFIIDRNYYYDIGATERFSIITKGIGECSAGLFDLIDFDKEIIEKKVLELNEVKSDKEKIKKLLDIIYHSSRMLLITRGVEPKSTEEIYKYFIEHFIKTDLVNKKFENIINLAINDKKEQILENYNLILELKDSIFNLYENMDDSFNFKKEINLEKKENMKNNKIIKDFRKIPCPLNFVKTKIELEKLKPNDLLEIYLDDGEPINNVPGSVQQEGHSILEIKKIDNYWSVLIKKGS